MPETKIEKEEEQAEEKPEKESWIKTKPEQLEKIIKELAEQGNSPAKIGIILRDKYSIPKARLLGKKIVKILKNSNFKYTTEKDTINEKIERIKSHIEKNKADKSAKRSLAKRLWHLYGLNKIQNIQ